MGRYVPDEFGTDPLDPTVIELFGAGEPASFLGEEPESDPELDLLVEFEAEGAPDGVEFGDDEEPNALDF